MDVVLEDGVQLVVFGLLIIFHFFVHFTDVFVGDEGFDAVGGLGVCWAGWKIRRSKRDGRYCWVCSWCGLKSEAVAVNVEICHIWTEGTVGD